jgi:hypothetical protein
MPSGEALEGFFMRPSNDFPADTAGRIRVLLRRAKDIAEQRPIQAVLMRALDALPPAQISPKCNTATLSLFLLDLLDAWPDEQALART